MYALILAAAVTFDVSLPIAEDYADMIEVNHYYDQNGKLVFDQVIFWQWWEEESSFHAFAWRFIKRPAQVPHRDLQRGGYVMIWCDGDWLRKVRSLSCQETWTQYDPEVHDRQWLSQDKRRGLIRTCSSRVDLRVPADVRR